MFHVYLLLSEKDNRTYVGSTDNLQRRLIEHNSGKNKSTRLRRPFRIVYSEPYTTEAQARQREQFLKSRKGRKELKKLFDDKHLNIAR